MYWAVLHTPPTQVNFIYFYQNIFSFKFFCSSQCGLLESTYLEVSGLFLPTSLLQVILFTFTKSLHFQFYCSGCLLAIHVCLTGSVESPTHYSYSQVQFYLFKRIYSFLILLFRSPFAIHVCLTGSVESSTHYSYSQVQFYLFKSPFYCYNPIITPFSLFY